MYSQFMMHGQKNIKLDYTLFKLCNYTIIFNCELPPFVKRDTDTCSFLTHRQET